MLDGCFYVTSDGGSMWWIIDNRLRAANSAFMTDNKCALPNQANWSVPFWNGKRKRKKGVHRQKLWYCVNTLLCVTTMQNHCYELAQKIKLDIFHTFMILDWLATFFSQSDWVKFHAHSGNTSGVCMQVCKSHRDLCVRELINETMANDLWSNLNS